MQPNNTTDTEQPAVAWFTDLLPDFPLAADEVLVTTTNDGNPELLLIPSALSPARHSPERDRFFIKYKAFEIIDTDEHGRYHVPPSQLYESTVTIHSFERLVEDGKPITRDKMNVHHTVPDDGKTVA